MGRFSSVNGSHSSMSNFPTFLGTIIRDKKTLKANTGVEIRNILKMDKKCVVVKLPFYAAINILKISIIYRYSNFSPCAIFKQETFKLAEVLWHLQIIFDLRLTFMAYQRF